MSNSIIRLVFDQKTTDDELKRRSSDVFIFSCKNSVLSKEINVTVSA